jgi:hypothetical protein
MIRIAIQRDKLSKFLDTKTNLKNQQNKKSYYFPTEHELIVLSLAVFAEMLGARLKVRRPQRNLNKHIFQ